MTPRCSSSDPFIKCQSLPFNCISCSYTYVVQVLASGREVQNEVHRCLMAVVACMHEWARDQSTQLIQNVSEGSAERCRE